MKNLQWQLPRKPMKAKLPAKKPATKKTLKCPFCGSTKIGWAVGERLPDGRTRHVGTERYCERCNQLFEPKEAAQIKIQKMKNKCYGCMGTTTLSECKGRCDRGYKNGPSKQALKEHKEYEEWDLRG